MMSVTLVINSLRGGKSCAAMTSAMISVGSPLEIRNSVFGGPQHGCA